MKVLFAGPSIYGLTVDLDGIDLRPPAAQGDLARAVTDGATAIGLVDGVYESVPAVWHKEVLWAIERGVSVLGAASMGALRAAECAAFGMEPIGVIALRYLEGSLDDDAAVAITYAPAELGYAPLSEALVDVEATLDNLHGLSLISDREAEDMRDNARKAFFKDRTVAAITDGLQRAATVMRMYDANRVSLKQSDARQLVDRLRTFPDRKVTDTIAWQLQRPAFWTRAEEALGPLQIGTFP